LKSRYGKAPIDQDGLAGYEPSFLRTEPNGHVANICRLAQALERSERFKWLGGLVIREAPKHRLSGGAKVRVTAQNAHRQSAEI
jgi:hypothetical protein